MPISDKYKVIFLHNPKTGGLSICDLLEFQVGFECLVNLYDDNCKPAYQHLTYNQLKIIIPPIKFNSYFKFTFVRNPWDKLVSTYYWNNRGFTTFTDFIYFIYNIFKNYTKPDIYNILNHPDFRSKFLSHILPQYLYTGPDVKIYRYENFEFEVKQLIQKYNINKNLPKDNVSKHNHYRYYYNETTKNLVQKIYAKDIELFGYVF